MGIQVVSVEFTYIGNDFMPESFEEGRIRGGGVTRGVGQA